MTDDQAQGPSADSVTTLDDDVPITSDSDLPGVPLVLAMAGSLLLLLCGVVRVTVWLVTGQ